MATYQIKVVDENNQGLPAKGYFLASSAGQGIVGPNGEVAGFETSVNGEAVFANGQPQVYARIESTGYTSVNTTLIPGLNTIKMSGVNGPEATITAKASSFWQRNKTVLTVLGLLLLLFTAWKMKWF